MLNVLAVDDARNATNATCVRVHAWGAKVLGETVKKKPKPKALANPNGGNLPEAPEDPMEVAKGLMQQVKTSIAECDGYMLQIED